ncbi:GPI inositol-deacylase-like, partial [Centruroides sculpturatus]|uniref:GPI inositol-deacylase-like n=1 Tax=Centruroides sculpturatus TaxID=218467 RepID=UPI000C6E24D4
NKVIHFRKGQFQGIPVIFVPGNAGSYRQVRSAGSVALQMAQSLNTQYHFNFFAVDFNEELSALFGGVLEKQTVFLQECVNYIRKLYRNSNTKIIFLGHSMGGIIIRSLLVNEKFNSSDIYLMITLASPHKRPVIAMDPFISMYYDKLQIEWQRKRYSELQHLSFISIAGGNRDLLVRSDLTIIPSSYNLQNDINVHTNSIPAVWVSTDHLCIIWCKQLVLSVIRTLFDLVDVKTKEVTTNMTLRQDVLNYHFLQKSMGKHFPNFPIGHVTFSLNAEWIMKIERSWRFNQNKAMEFIYFLVPLNKDEHIIATATGLIQFTWVIACNQTNFSLSKINSLKLAITKYFSSESENLVKQTEMIPTKTYDMRRLIYVKSETLLAKEYSHLLIIASPSGNKIDILCERFKFKPRHHNILLPDIFQNLKGMFSVNILNIPLADGVVYFRIKFINLNSIWQAYILNLHITRCKQGTKYQGIAKLIIPWSKEKYFYMIKSHTEIPLKLNIPQMSFVDNHVQLHLILDPECGYSLTAHTSIAHMVQQFFKFYVLLIPSYVAALTLSVLSKQFFSISSEGICPSFIQALNKFPSLFGLVMLPMIYFKMRDMNYLPGFLPYPDDFILQNEGLYFLGLRPILYFIAYGFIVLISSAQYYFITINGYYLNVLKNKYYKNGTERKTSKHLFIPILLMSTLFIFAMLSSSLCIFFLFVIDLIKLIPSCGKCIIEEDRKGINFRTRRWHIRMAVNFLLFLMFCLLIPSFIVWVRNIKSSVISSQDPFLIIIILIMMTCYIFWKDDELQINRFGYKFLSYVLYTLAVLTTMFTVIKIYYIIYSFTIALCIIAFIQVINNYINKIKCE